MTYETLHRRRQLVAAETVNRQWYLTEAKECSWVEDIEIWRTDGLEQEKLLGYVVKHGPGFIHGMVHNYTVVIAKGLPQDVERFVCIKELMHCFFPADDGTATDSELLLESHIRQLFGQSTARSAHVLPERTASWMALGVICPERTRRELVLEAKVENGVQGVCDRLRIPLGATKLLLSDQADLEFAKLIN